MQSCSDKGVKVGLFVLVVAVLVFASAAHAQTAACCLGEQCQELEQADCKTQGGEWHGDRPTPPGPISTCDNVICPRPANDDCVDALNLNGPGQPCELQSVNHSLGRCDGSGPINADPHGGCILPDGDGFEDCIFAGDLCIEWPLDGYFCEVRTNNLLATTDGPTDAGGDCSVALTMMHADVWYRYTAPCSGELSIRTCDEPTYDMMLSVYDYNPANCPPINAADFLACDDDFCPGNATTSGNPTPIDVIEGDELLIRVGGYYDGGPGAADEGISEMEISVFCGTDPCGDPPGLTFVEANRYLAFQPSTAPGEQIAIRVTLPDGRFGWVGEPVLMSDRGVDFQWVAQVEGSAVGDGSDQMREWTTYTDPLTGVNQVLVTGCVIVPGHTYELHGVAGSQISTCSLNIDTTPIPTLAGSWANCVGLFDGGSGRWTPPNDATNFNDIAAVIDGFQQKETAPVRWIDLAPQWPNYLINFADVEMVIKGFQEVPYPVPPTDCPTIANCPLGGDAPCLP